MNGKTTKPEEIIEKITAALDSDGSEKVKESLQTLLAALLPADDIYPEASASRHFAVSENGTPHQQLRTRLLLEVTSLLENSTRPSFDSLLQLLDKIEEELRKS